MRHVLLLSTLLFGLLLTTAAQTNTRQQDYLDVYKQALAYNDLTSAAYALTGYLLQGGQETYKDTLALIYYNTNNYAGAYKLAGELNGKDPKNITALTLLADITSKAGEVKSSLEWYEKLCALNPNSYNHYQMSTKQFVLERNLECKESLQKILTDSATAMQQKVRLDIGEGYGEEVPVYAAALNMMGAIAFREKNNTAAGEWYQKAVQAFPEFVIAQQNLTDLNKPAVSPVEKTSSQPPTKTKDKKN